MYHRAKTLLLSPFVSDSIVSISIGLFANISNYIFFVIAARAMLPAQFGELNALVAILTIATTVGNSIYFEIARIAGISPDRRALILKLGGIFLKSGVLFLVASGFLAASGVKELLNTSYAAFAALALVILLFILSTVSSALLAGSGRLKRLAWFNFEGSLAKALFVYPLVQLFPSVMGGLMAYGAGYIVNTIRSVRHYLNNPRVINLQMEDQKGGGLYSFFTYLLLLYPFCIDQVLVHARAPEISGEYAAVALLGKLVFFAALPVGAVIFNYQLQSCSNKRLFFKYLLASQLGALACAIIMSASLLLLLPFFENALFGAKYSLSTALVSAGCVAYGCYLLFYCVVLAFIAKRIRCIIVPLALVAVVQTVAFLISDMTVAGAIYIQLATFAAGFCLMGISLLCLYIRWPQGAAEPNSTE